MNAGVMFSKISHISISKMNTVPKIKHFFRKPKYPVIVDVDGVLVCGKSSITLSRRLSEINLIKSNSYNVVDSSIEGWVFIPKHWVISPMTFKKRWTKLELIRMYNGRKNKKNEDFKYSEKSLSSKRLDKVFNDIFQLLDKSHS